VCTNPCIANRRPSSSSKALWALGDKGQKVKKGFIFKGHYLPLREVMSREGGSIFNSIKKKIKSIL